MDLRACVRACYRTCELTSNEVAFLFALSVESVVWRLWLLVGCTQISILCGLRSLRSCRRCRVRPAATIFPDF